MIMASVGASVGAALAPAGLEKSVGAVTAAYMKDAADKVWENDKGMVRVDRFHEAVVSARQPERRQQSVWLFAAQTVVAVLRQCGDNLTRENVMKQAASLKNVELPLLLPVSVSTPALRISCPSRTCGWFVSTAPRGC